MCSTNHVDRLHLDLLRVTARLFYPNSFMILQLVDEQGLRVEFPNASMEIMEGPFFDI